MDDDFYASSTNVRPPSSAWRSVAWGAITSPNVVLALLLGPFIIAIVTRYLSGRSVEASSNGKAKRPWKLPYWVPGVGHGFPFLMNPVKLMREAGDRSPHDMFSLNLGGTTHNIISDPSLVRSVMAQRESTLLFKPIAISVVRKFFGIPPESVRKFDKVWDEMNATTSYLMREPHIGIMIDRTVHYLENHIPQMITFTDADIDLQPWERWANASYISSTETEINLMTLMRDMMGNASVPAMFGSAFIEKYPDILHDIYATDAGMYFFLLGLPAWTPWPGVIKAHIARRNVWQALDEHQRALDALALGKPFDYSWGELDDVSEFIVKRNEVQRRNGFEIRERGEFSVLWALVVNSSLLVYWQLLYILSVPGLADRIRAEIAPYVTVTQGATIGKISETPKLHISHPELSRNCPLLKSTYFEALRMSDQPWSVRQVGQDVVISGDKKADDPATYLLKKGEYVTIPHDLHMKDPKYFKYPEEFDPERFLVTKEDGSVEANMGTIRPYGGGPSWCKGRIIAERECLAQVAGILAFWDITPADKQAGWVIPKQKKTAAVSLPVHETRVRIKRRVFDWER
ncbi:Cytochrome P450 [Venustampulla echinocandica]|uniref:Cytochrome P450 n=1 Tax=Venustampulla echinocandica TaxID=2656787 RepID=A0A370TIC9_9HELO|nr:Cytochrome P450 [Venustampulla echinocandica]RDL35113.1 Cytochrome P450 [Venustampulla echinocandica]